MIEDRSNQTRKAALEGLKIIAKPGDFTCLSMLVTNIHQINHFEAVKCVRVGVWVGVRVCGVWVRE